MQPFKVDVPVKINIWIRTECLKKQFEVLKKARPSILFIQSDGGRNSEEWEKIYTNRKMIDEGIDWDCTVYRLYEDHNNGLYTMMWKTMEFIWARVDRCIILEDDLIPEESFFQYCAELLERYKDDERIECICGFNNLGTWDRCTSDYFFSRQGAVWGLAIWKRVVDEYGDFSYGSDKYVMSLLKQRTRHNPIAWRRLCAYANKTVYEGHIPGGEFYHEFFMYSQNRLQIVPRRNLISCVGACSDSEHADVLSQMPRGFRKVFNSKTYEMVFPMVHPKYVIPDVEYEKKRNRVMAYNTPVIKLLRDFERAFIKIRSGNFSYVMKKVKKRFLEKVGERSEK